MRLSERSGQVKNAPLDLPCRCATRAEDAKRIAILRSRNQEFRVIQSTHDDAPGSAIRADAVDRCLHENFHQSLYLKRSLAVRNQLQHTQRIVLAWMDGSPLMAVLATAGPGHGGPRLVSVSLPGRAVDVLSPKFRAAFKDLSRQASLLEVADAIE